VLTVISCHRGPRDAAPPERSAPTAQLLRAAVDGAPFGYVDIADLADDEAVAAVARTRATRPDVLTGAYAVFHVGETSAEPFDAGAPDSSVIFVNCMAMPPENADAAFALWQEVNVYMVAKPGYRWHRLHRRVADDAPFGLINVVEWESIVAWQAAHDEGFRQRAVRPDMPMTTFPTLCMPVTVDTVR
jgi:hypothetical protein